MATNDELEQRIIYLEKHSNGKDAIQVDMIGDLKKEFERLRGFNEAESSELRREMTALSVSVREVVAQSKAWYDLVNKDLNNLGEKVRENKGDIKRIKEKPGRWIDRGLTAGVAATVSAIVAWLITGVKNIFA